jgi:hypothetical protein
MKISLDIQFNKATLWRNVAVGAPIVAAMGLLGVTLRRRSLMEPFFVQGTYFVLLTMVAFWASTYMIALKDTSKERLVAWLKDNWRGLVLAAVVSLVAILAVEPALRVLADETNLLGVSKNLHFNKTADFATTGKWYYESYWNLNVTMDRRPSLFPFLVSLIHALRGYSYTNAFHANAILIPLLVFVAYRLAKSLGGEAYGILAGAFVITHPITLISARSAGFDVMAGFFALLAVKHFFDYAESVHAYPCSLRGRRFSSRIVRDPIRSAHGEVGAREALPGRLCLHAAFPPASLLADDLESRRRRTAAQCEPVRLEICGREHPRLLRGRAEAIPSTLLAFADSGAVHHGDI